MFVNGWAHRGSSGGISVALAVCELRDVSFFHHSLLIDLVVSL